METLRKEISLAALSSTQLKNLSGQPNRELANLTTNTESFLNKARQLQKDEPLTPLS